MHLHIYSSIDHLHNATCLQQGKITSSTSSFSLFRLRSQSQICFGTLVLFSIYLFSWFLCQEFCAREINHSLKICQILNHKCADLSPVAFSSTLVLGVVIHGYKVLSDFICNGCILIGTDIAEGNVCCYCYRMFVAFTTHARK